MVKGREHSWEGHLRMAVVVVAGAVALAACDQKPPQVPETQVASVRALMRGLASPACAERQRAALDSLDILDTSADAIPLLERELRAAPPDVQRRGRLLADNANRFIQMRREGGHLHRLLQAVDRAREGSEAEQKVRVDRLVEDLMKLARDRSQDPFDRYLTISTIWALWGQGSSGTSHTADLPPQILDLLRHPDPDIRGVAAATVGRAERLPEDQERILIGGLIEALSHPDFGTRLKALHDLRQRTGQEFCVDPMDEEGQREAEIGRWREWWGLSLPKIPSGL